MHTEPPHASLQQLHQLGLITAQELDEANAERDVATYERLHPSKTTSTCRNWRRTPIWQVPWAGCC